MPTYSLNCSRIFIQDIHTCSRNTYITAVSVDTCLFTRTPVIVAAFIHVMTRLAITVQLEARPTGAVKAPSGVYAVMLAVSVPCLAFIHIYKSSPTLS